MLYLNRDINAFENENISGSLKKDIAFFKKIFKDDALFRTRIIENSAKEAFCCILFMDGMVNSSLINESIIKPLVISNTDINNDTKRIISKHILFTDEISESENLKELLTSLLYGDSILLIENSNKALILNTKGWRKRGISEPKNEEVSQGPHEGFDEAVMLNAASLRRKMATPDLRIHSVKLGRKTNTKIFICYIDSLVNKNLLNKVTEKIKSIEIDGILDSNYISELINENKYSLFKTIGTTERPDTVASRLLEGRIAILTDGTPVAVTLPYFFAENFQADDDYYTNFTVASIGRILRYICFYIAITLPALYIALSVFHPQLLPASFLNTISETRNGVPFSSFTEVILLVSVFEILKETGLRMQQNLGHALSIVGGLVVGQAAVEARIVSAPVLIVTALCGISGLMVPRLKGAVFYCKLLLIILASLLGLYGFFAGLVIIHIHLYSLESFGVDYVSPAMEFTFQSLKDTIIRAEWSKMLTRPKSLTENIIRLKFKK